MLGIDPGVWPAVNALLDRAMDVPADSRRAWLDALPPEDAPYRDTLMRLLAEHGGVESGALFADLARFGAESFAERGDAALEAGGHVGPYVLLSPIGSGGMGSVWLAERADSQPRRKVALKLPHLGWAPGLAERVRRERDILASLEHPNIARLYDAGVDTLGRPYLALEYVDGAPIDRHAAEHDLSVSERLRLFLQVTDAVAQAHAQLVVHRDLKPSNVLVTPKGEVRLLDFGIAKLLEDSESPGEATELTRLEGRPLTPEYASPEQIRGDPVGTPSDVYSLGIVLYELLAGKRPYSLGKAKAGSLSEAIAAVDVPPASRTADSPSTRRQLAGDLDAILNKALKKGAAERYVTVAAFAEDVRRYLAGAPVAARPDTVGYRTRKFVARNALKVGAVSAVLLAVLSGAALAFWQARVARAEAARADETKSFALSFFESADTNHGTGAATTAVDLLVDAQRRVETELKDKPAVAVELMTAIGESLAAQSKVQQACDLLRKTVALSTATFGRDDPHTLGAEALLGTTLIDLGKIDETIALMTSTVQRARRIGAKRELVVAMENLGLAQVANHQIDEGIANSRAAAELIETLDVGTDKSLPGDTWLTYANVLQVAGRPGVATAARHAIELDRAVSGGRTTRTSLLGRGIYADGLAQEHRVREALGELGTLLDDATRFYGPDQREVSLIASTLGRVRLAAGYPDLALQAYTRALAISRQQDATNLLVEAIGTWNVGRAQFAGMHWVEALAAFDQTVAVLDTKPRLSNPRLWQAQIGRVAALLHLGRDAEAERAITALAGQPLDPQLHALLQGQLAALRSRQGRHQEAIALAREAVPTQAENASAQGRAAAERQLGAVLLAAGRSGDAIAPLRQALTLLKESELTASPQQIEIADELDRAELAPPPAKDDSVPPSGSLSPNKSATAATRH
jgi:tetratricopeptide (TPR) repeat protein